MNNRSVESQIVWNTIIELHLRAYHKARNSKEWAQYTPQKVAEEIDKRERAIEDVLKKPEANYDQNSALCLVQMMGCGRGQLYLYEKMRMFHLVVQHFMDKGDTAEVIKKAKKYGKNDPNLWVNVLTYFASQKEVPKVELSQVLDYIDREGLLQPMLIIQILAKNPQIKIAVIKYVSGITFFAMCVQVV